MFDENDDSRIKQVWGNPHLEIRLFFLGVFFIKEKRMTPNQRARYLYDVLARQPINPISMRIIRNSKDALNKKFGTHVEDMTRIIKALNRLENTGWVKVSRVKNKKFSTTKQEWYEEESRDLVFVFKNKQKKGEQDVRQ